MNSRSILILHSMDLCRNKSYNTNFMKKNNFIALWGTFDEHMLPINTKVVTDIIKVNFLVDSHIVIPYNYQLKHYFGDINQVQLSSPPSKNSDMQKRDKSFLQIQVGARKHNILDDNYNGNIIIDLNNNRKRIKLIYFAFIYRYTNWIAIVRDQLLQLKSYGLLDEVDLYIHLTDPTGIFSDVIELIQTVTTNAMISTTLENQFEYPAIKLAYDLARECPDDIFMYFHTKGMSYEIHSRLPLEIALLTGTFENWRRKMEAFNDPTVNKMGMFPAEYDPNVMRSYNTKGGWMWYNFWYARGRYIANCCEDPKISLKRWYYEVWLGGPYDENSLAVTDCKNLYEYQNKKVFAGVDIEKTLPDLIAMGQQNKNLFSH